jgi:hypothetical protein
LIPTPRRGSTRIVVAVLVAGAFVTLEAAAQSTYVLVAGRRLPYLYAISLEAALDPANDLTSNAVVARSKVALDRLDGRPLGDPANLVVSEDGRTVYVVNHHGAIDNAEFVQHGGRGLIAVLDLEAVLEPSNDRTANALVRHMDSGGFGAATGSTSWTGGREASVTPWSSHWARRASTVPTTLSRTSPRTDHRGTWRSSHRIRAGDASPIRTASRSAAEATGGNTSSPRTEGPVTSR